VAWRDGVVRFQCDESIFPGCLPCLAVPPRPAPEPPPHISQQVRREIAGKALQDVVAALRTDIDIAVFDAANCTRAWRRWIRQQVQEAGLYAQTIFIEAQCESGELIASNIHQTILRSPEVKDKRGLSGRSINRWIESNPHPPSP